MKFVALETQVQAERTAPRGQHTLRVVRPVPSGWRLLGQKILRDRLAVVGLCILLGLLAEIMTRTYFESQGGRPYAVRPRDEDE